MNNSKNFIKEFIKKDFLVQVFYCLFLFTLTSYFIFLINRGYSKDCYNISEFLINYEGGFVRRGLIGQLLLFFHKNFNISVYYTIICICVLSYLVLVYFFVRSFIKNGYTLFILPFCFFLGFPIMFQTWARKDVLLVLLFILAIKLSYKKEIKHLILLNIVLSIGLLVHELIGFLSFPFLILLLNHNQKTTPRYGLVKNYLIVFLKLFPSIFTFLSVLYFHGTKEISLAIFKSWENVYFPAIKEECRGNAIDALSWSVTQELSVVFKNVFMQFDYGIYAPLAWTITFLILYYILTNTHTLNFKLFSYKPFSNFDKTHISNLLILQFMAVFPLFITGVDYGRWIFFWITTSFVLILLIPKEILAKLFPLIIQKISERINYYLSFCLKSSFVLLFILTLGISGDTWKLGYTILSSSIFYISYFFYNFQSFLAFLYT